MKIHFLPQEMELIRKEADEYRKRTGDNYSSFHVMSILTNEYEKNLASDLKRVMDIKIREFEEESAKQGFQQ